LIASEAGELLALFRWDQDALTERLDEVEAELADVLLGVLRFADVAGIDLHAAALRKLEANARKYPARPQLGPDPVRKATSDAPVVCGVDAGTLTSTSYVAWLRGNEFVHVQSSSEVALAVTIMPLTPKPDPRRVTF
jgi:hypothetical protein